MMTSRERIRTILDFKTPDRVGIMDMFWDETRKAWQALLKEKPEDHFDLDMRLLDGEKEIKKRELEDFFSGTNGERFLALSFRDPFQRYADDVGLETALENIGRDPNAAFRAFKKRVDEVLSRAIGVLDRGYHFDGIWVYGDIAYKDGLYFSKDFYERSLFPFHKEICFFFASYGIPTILHSDGDISSIIPLLIKAGFRALHPMQRSAGLDVSRLKAEYKKDIAFLGNFGVELLSGPREKSRGLLIDRLGACKEGGCYIFGLDGPIDPSAKIDDYGYILDTVKEYGRY